MTISNGKSSGSWKAWKSCVAWWVKTIFIFIGIALGTLIGIFVTYKSIRALRISSLNKAIAQAEAELKSFSY